MNNHTDNITVAALRQWILAHQDDTGCNEAADVIGELEAVSTLLEMLDGPLTPRCALALAEALGNHADASHLAHLRRHRDEHGKIAFMIRCSIEEIEESQGECTCGQCPDAFGDASEPDGMEPPMMPPFSRN